MKKVFFLLFVIISISFFSFPFRQAQAQYCGEGAWGCCQGSTKICTPDGCLEGEPGCTCTWSADRCSSGNCAFGCGPDCVGVGLTGGPVCPGAAPPPPGYSYAQGVYYSYSYFYNYSYSYSQATYSLSGAVVEDDNRNKIRDNGEILHRVGDSLDGSSISINNDSPGVGQYIRSGLSSGTYSLRYGPLPLGFELTFPLSGEGGLFRVSLGQNNCDVDPTGGDADCNQSSGNATNINYGITRSLPWIQAIGGDLRFDKGFDHPIPLDTSTRCGDNYVAIAGDSNAPGIIFIGRDNPNTAFGDGEASTKDWVVGGTTYPERFTPEVKGVIRASYTYMYENIQKKDTIYIRNLLTSAGSTCTSSSNCTLPDNLASGVYRRPGGLTLLGFNPSATGQNYVFLVDGDLRIRGQITIPNGTTAHFFVSGDILVDPDVGRSIGSNLVCGTSAGHIEGVFATDKSFVIQSAIRDPGTGEIDCNLGSDRQLSIQGTIIVNAGLTSGKFDQQRSLCAPDSRNTNGNYPTVTIRERPDFVLNAPDWVRSTTYIWQEVAP